MTPSSIRSKNILNRPEYEALNTGLTTITPTARPTVPYASVSAADGTCVVS